MIPFVRAEESGDAAGDSDVRVQVHRRSTKRTAVPGRACPSSGKSAGITVAIFA